MSLMASGMSGKGQLAPASHPVDLDHSGYTAADVDNTSGQSCHAEDGTKGRHGDLLQELQSTRLLLLQTQCIVDSKASCHLNTNNSILWLVSLPLDSLCT